MPSQAEAQEKRESVVYQRLLAIGRFEADFPTRQDWMLWLRQSVPTCVLELVMPCQHFRRHDKHRTPA